MHTIEKLILAAALMANAQPVFSAVSLRPETTPPVNEGATSIEELGPVFARPLPEEQPHAPAAPPTAQNKMPQKKDLLSLFQDDNKPKEEKNPLEEEARNETKVLDDPENLASTQAPQAQLGENKPADSITMAENAPQALDLDKANPDSKSLPNILRQENVG